LHDEVYKEEAILMDRKWYADGYQSSSIRKEMMQNCALSLPS
jgi:hypothetical protein